MADTQITLDLLLKTSRGELDKLFSSSVGGDVPVGRGTGTVVFAPNSVLTRLVAVLARLFLWKGKEFDSSTDTLLNLIGPFGTRAIRAKVYTDSSWFDGKDVVVLDYSRTSRVAHWIHDEIREVAPNLYLGLVYWSRRKVLFFVLDFAKATKG
jgi:hypothetical protein